MFWIVVDLYCTI